MNNEYELKVYVIVTTNGSYDEKDEKIAGVFHNRENAIEFAESIVHKNEWVNCEVWQGSEHLFRQDIDFDI